MRLGDLPVHGVFKQTLQEITVSFPFPRFAEELWLLHHPHLHLHLPLMAPSFLFLNKTQTRGLMFVYLEPRKCSTPLWFVTWRATSVVVRNKQGWNDFEAVCIWSTQQQRVLLVVSRMEPCTYQVLPLSHPPRSRQHL